MDDRAEGLSADALAGFWSWWASVRDLIAAAIADGSLGRSPLVDDTSSAVHGLHPGLAWELGPGRSARHNLTVTPEGNMALRRLTAQWLDSAPQPDQTWEYYASRQPTEPLGLEIGGKRFAPEEFRVAYSYDDSRERFNVQLYHPQFKKASDDLVRHVLFLTVDECLGEDDVERWIGSLEASKSSPSGAVSLKEFVPVVAAASKNATGDRFTLGQGRSSGGHPVFITVNTALKQIDHLDHVHHVVAVIALREPNSNGLPGDAEAEGLNLAEDRLIASFGPNAVQIGRVTWAGRREIHFFARDAAQAEATLTAWAGSMSPRPVHHAISYDPEWSASKQGIYAALAPRAGR